MSNWLTRLFRPARKTPVKGDERALELERGLQALRIELAERDQTITRLKADLERDRSAGQALIAESVQSRIERLFSELATPVSQLMTQAYLLETEGKPVQARDVLSVARRFIRPLEDLGLSIEGQVGATVAFDPNRHEPLSHATDLRPGEPVKIKLVGIAGQGKILRRAGVEKQ